ncbi:hypothetical protein GOP47_0024568 [Adiantum capillus-veneris]|uniref:Replication protein A C-terminal domain-containing protein n=1 Tax=Adiantum capillus-veneris TaxID=13818 RepID=A0A9D4U2C6_ADICA|nr:hypothetical protein GOP47_0024568 [Adiantum capillus-veneris]
MPFLAGKWVAGRYSPRPTSLGNVSSLLPSNQSSATHFHSLAELMLERLCSILPTSKGRFPSIKSWLPSCRPARYARAISGRQNRISFCSVNSRKKPSTCSRRFKVTTPTELPAMPSSLSLSLPLSPSLLMQQIQSSHSKKGNPKTAGVLPLTVKQASQAMQNPFDDTFTVYGADINIVTLLGMVVDKEENTSHVSFALDDGTGRVDVNCWMNGQEMHTCKEILKVQNGGYVCIYGHLCVLQGKKSIVALSIRLIVDFNEVTFHFLESVYVHVLRANSMGHNIPSNQIGGSITSYMQAPSSFYNDLVDYTPSYPVNTDGSPEACVRRVQSIFEEPHNLTLEAGLHVDDVIRRMNGFGIQQVRVAIELLVNEGMIYSTIDDDHYRSTSG